MLTLEVKTRILPGGGIEIPNTGLPEGREATVRIVVDEEPAPPKRSFRENLGDYKGGQLFKSAEEVDQYIREERDSWGD
jgi:hypothetical protein